MLDARYVTDIPVVYASLTILLVHAPLIPLARALPATER